MSSSLDLYRTLVPAHSAVSDDFVETMLELATRRHTASAWGQVYPEAMVWWAAHRVQCTPGSGAGGSTADAVGPVVSQSDGDLSRTYAQPASDSAASAEDLTSTRYGQAYLDLRRTRAASTATVVGVC